MYAAPHRQNTEAACFIERAGNAEVYVPMHRIAVLIFLHITKINFLSGKKLCKKYSLNYLKKLGNVFH